MRHRRHEPTQTEHRCTWCSLFCRRVPRPGRKAETEDWDAYFAQGELAQAAVTAHERAFHPAHWIVRRLGELRQEVRGETLDTLDWQTDPRAIEYRALMREWWALPAIPIGVLLDRSSDPTPGWFTRDRNKLLKLARLKGKRQLTIGSTHYRFNPEVLKEATA